MAQPFDAGHAPFNRLRPEEIGIVRAALDIGYFRPGETIIARDGAPLPFDAFALSAQLRAQRDTHIRLVLSAHGNAACRFWTCDLTADYIRLNADYTT